MAKPLDELPYLEWLDDAGQTHRLYPDVILSEQHSLSASVSEHPVETGANVNDHYRKNPDNPTLTMIFSESPIRGDLGEVKGSTSFVSLSLAEKRRLGFTPGDVALSLAPVAVLTPRGALVAGASIAAGYALGALTGAVGNLLGGGSPISPTPGNQGLTFPSPPARGQEAYDAIQEIMNKGYLLTVSSIVARYEAMAILDANMTRDAAQGDALHVQLSLSRLRLVQSETTEAVALPEEPRAQKKKGGKNTDASATGEGEGPGQSVLHSLLN